MGKLWGIISKQKSWRQPNYEKFCNCFKLHRWRSILLRFCSSSGAQGRIWRHWFVRIQFYGPNSLLWDGLLMYNCTRMCLSQALVRLLHLNISVYLDHWSLTSYDCWYPIDWSICKWTMNKYYMIHKMEGLSLRFPGRNILRNRAPSCILCCIFV